MEKILNNDVQINEDTFDILSILINYVLRLSKKILDVNKRVIMLEKEKKNL